MVSDLQTSLYISLRWDQDAMAHTAATLARMYGDFAAKTEIVEYMFSQVKVFVSRPVFFFGHRPECFWNDRKKWVISVGMSENIGQWTLLRQVLIQLRDMWPKYLSKKRPKCLSDKKSGSAIS